MDRYVDVAGARLWTVTTGAGRPVLLSSGGPGCCDYLEPVASLLRSAAVTRWEQRGCGRSGGLSPFRLADCLADMEAIRRSLGHERWIVAGHSWGADLSLIYALEHPEHVLALICLSGGRVNNDRDWHAAYRAGRDAGREPELEYRFPPNLAVNRDLNLEFKRYMKHPALLRDLARLPAPALFVYGADDIRPPWPVEQVAQLIPRAQFTLIDGAAHNLWLTHGAELGKRLTAFLRSPELP